MNDEQNENRPDKEKSASGPYATRTSVDLAMCLSGLLDEVLHGKEMKELVQKIESLLPTRRKHKALELYGEIVNLSHPRTDKALAYVGKSAKQPNQILRFNADLALCIKGMLEERMPGISMMGWIRKIESVMPNERKQAAVDLYGEVENLCYHERHITED